VDQGILEGVDGEHISGFARLKNQLNSSVTVEIYDGETLLATVPAEQFRPDLRDLGMGNGEHAFSFPTPARLKDWRPHEIRAKIAGTNIELSGSPKTIILPGNQVAPDKAPGLTHLFVQSFGAQGLTPAGAPLGALMQRLAALGVMESDVFALDRATVVGSLDGADVENIFGWAWDKKDPNNSIDVDIYEGDGVLTLLATVPATVFRQNLLDAKIGDGRHGFSYPTPARLKDGKAHTIWVTTSGTKVELDGSPKTVTLKSP
jgi:hypothetical protein